MSRGNEFNQKFRILFESEKQKILFNQEKLNAQFAYTAEEMMDEVDFTSLELENQMKMRLRNRESIYLKKINDSLLRLSEGTFGKCESCEEDIELKRLEARPTTTECLSCKEHSERMEQIHIDGHKHKSLAVAPLSRIRLA